MVDQVNQEEEYHFQDLGDTGNNEQAPQSAGPEDPGSSSSMLDVKKKVIMAAGGAMVIVILYSFFSSSGTTNKKPEQQALKQPNQLSSSLPKPISQAPVVVEPPKPMPVQQPQQAATAVPETLEQLDKLSSALSSIEAVIRDLDVRLIDLQANQVKLQKQLDSKKQAVMKKSAAKAKALPPVGESYKVLGVIYGRAWLKTPKGSTLTVRPGDNLPGYGSVKIIEPEQGVVIMSTGDVIRFDEDL